MAVDVLRSLVSEGRAQVLDALLLFVDRRLLEDVDYPRKLVVIDVHPEVLELRNFSLCDLIVLLLEGPTLVVGVVLVRVDGLDVLYVVGGHGVLKLGEL